MGEYFVVGIYVLAALLGLINPRLGLLLFWPVIMCYPVWTLAEKLPLNAGLDDVFLVCLFIGSLIKNTGKLQAVKPIIYAVLFCVILFIGDLSTIASGHHLSAEFSWKLWLKHLGLIFLIVPMCLTTSTPEHIRKMVFSLLFGSALAGLLVIFYTVNPHAYNPFQVPFWMIGKDWWLQQSIGPFNYRDEAGGTLGFIVLLGYFLIRFDKGILKKQFIVIITAVSFIALMASGSRSGWLFILFPLILSSLLSKKKIVGIFLIGLFAIGVFLSFTKIEFFSSRIEQTVTQLGGGTLYYMTVGRSEHWELALASPKISWLFCGEGFGIMKGLHTHSNYIAMLKNTGLIGIIFWFILYKEIFQKSFWLMKYDHDRRMSALFAGIFWSYIGYFMFFIPSTPMMWSRVRYVNFFLMTLVHLRYKQVESETEYYFEEELYQTELDCDPVY